MNHYKFLCFLACLFFLASCQKERPKVYEVPNDIQVYIDNFEAEAQARGHSIIVDDLVVEFGFNLEADGTEAAGLCHYETTDVGPRIQLDTTSENWQAHLESRETLIFHELGHCVLNRPHINNTLANGNYKSIMKASGEPIFAAFNTFKRDYYLDELFNPGTPAPDWASGIAYNAIAGVDSNYVLKENFNSNFNNNWLTGEFDVILAIEDGVYSLKSNVENPIYVSRVLNIDTNKDFQIETSIKVIQGAQFSNCLLWGSKEGDNNNPAELYQYGFNQDKDCIVFNNKTGDYVSQPTSALVEGEFNKLTIRKVGDKMYFFVNEEFREVTDFMPFHGNEIGFLTPGLTEMEVDYVYVFEF